MIAVITSIGSTRDVRRVGNELVTGPNGIRSYMELSFANGRTLKLKISKEMMEEIGATIGGFDSVENMRASAASLIETGEAPTK